MKNPLPEEEYKKRKRKKDYSPRSDYFRDQTAIIHSMPFRRLKHKTQVFFSPENDHVCTRIEHVLHVATIGATICKGLNDFGWKLNPEMAYAIGLGHDLGHAPFGHAGEEALSNKLVDHAGEEALSSKLDNKFIHEVHGLRTVDKLCYNGKGLNLTYGVRDGIITHNGEDLQQKLKPAEKLNDLEKIKDRKAIPSSYEGCIVRFSDVIAYLGRDIEDAYLANIIKFEDIPEIIRNDVGKTNGDIIDHLVNDIIHTSKESDSIMMSDDMFKKVQILQKFNKDRIYNHPTISNYRTMGENIIKELFDYLIDKYNNYGKDYEKYKKNGLDLDRQFGNYIQRYESMYNKEGDVPKVIVCDYIAGMTDNYALNAMKQIKIPEPIQFI